MNIKIIFAFVLLFLVMIFTLQNSELVNINFLFWHVTLSRAFMLFLVLAVGLIVGFILGNLGSKSRVNKEE